MGVKELLNRKLTGMAILFACMLLAACNSGDGDEVGPEVTEPEPDPVENYSVGGSLNEGDVIGEGLVLKLNGDQTVSISPDDEEFVFSEEIEDGSSFQISVDAPPRGPLQTCTVSPSSGEIDGADILDINVSCNTQSFRVGGNVSGLQGSGFRLELSDGQGYSPSGDGEFTFNSRLDDQTSFSVSIARQPELPDQQCALSGHEGVVDESNYMDIEIHCATDLYAISGEIHGLEPSDQDLVLALNGAALPAINGSEGSGVIEFESDYGLPTGSSFSVTVEQAPSGPVQNCVVSNGEGVVGSDAHDNVRVDCQVQTFSVGGSVVGLDGEGFQLSLNGGQQLDIPAGSSEFTFDQPIPDRSEINVSVSSAPTNPSQVCVVDQGNGGVIDGEDYNDLLISCETEKFTVGGQVTGLEGEYVGLRLSSNNLGSSQTKDITSNGDFVFDQHPIDDQSSFTVVVPSTEHPVNPKQTCSVTGGDGNIDGSNYHGVMVECVTETYTVSTNVDSGSGSLSPSQAQVEHGKTETFTAIPGAGYEVSGFSGCNGSRDGDEYTTGEITSDCTINVDFSLIEYQVSYSSSNCNISGDTSQTVKHGESGASVTASPKNNYEWDRWSNGSTSRTRSEVNVTSDVHLVAECVLATYTVTASSGGGGSISPSSRTVTHGNTTSFSVSINDGYMPKDSNNWGCGGSFSGGGYSTGTITNDCSIHAEFETFCDRNPEQCDDDGNPWNFSGELLFFDWDESVSEDGGSRSYRVASVSDRSGAGFLEKVVEGRPPLRVEGVSTGGDSVRVSRIRPEKEGGDASDHDSSRLKAADGAESLESIETETVVVERPPVTQVPDVPYQESVDSTCAADILPQPWLMAEEIGGQDLRVSSDGASAIWLSRAEGDWVRLAWNQEYEVWSEEWRVPASSDIQAFDVDAFHRRAYALDFSGELRMLNLVDVSLEEETSDETGRERASIELPVAGDTMGEPLSLGPAMDFVVDPAGHWVAVLDSDQGVQMYRWDPWSAKHAYVRTDSYSGDWMALKPGGEVLYLGTTAGKDSAESFLYAFAVNPENLELRLLGAEKVDYPQGKPSFTPDGKYMIDDSGKQQWLLPIDEDSHMPIHGSMYSICPVDDGSTEGSVD